MIQVQKNFWGCWRIQAKKIYWNNKVLLVKFATAFEILSAMFTRFRQQLHRYSDSVRQQSCSNRLDIPKKPLDSSQVTTHMSKFILIHSRCVMSSGVDFLALADVEQSLKFFLFYLFEDQFRWFHSVDASSWFGMMTTINWK